LQRRPRPEGLRSWLGAVTRRQAARFRYGRLRRLRIERAQASQSTAEDPVDVVARLHQQRWLVEHVLDLPTPYRTVIVRRYFDGLTAAEIARRQNLPAATVRQQIRRALAMLRERLDREAGREWRHGLLGLAWPGPVRAGAMPGVLMMKKTILCTLVAVLLATLWIVLPVDRTARVGPTVPAAAVTKQVEKADATARGTAAGADPSRHRLATARTGTVRITVVSADETPIAGADVWIHGGGVVRSGAT